MYLLIGYGMRRALVRCEEGGLCACVQKGGGAGAGAGAGGVAHPRVGLHLHGSQCRCP